MAPNTDPAESPLNPAALKTRFKKQCNDHPDSPDNWGIRAHRALSWHKRATELPADQPEARYLFYWISLNSLYSRWDAQRNAPGADRDTRQSFIRRLIQFDSGGRISAMLHQQRPLIKKILGNPFLSSVFWRDPHHPKARGWASEDVNYLEKNFREHNYQKLLEQVFDRLYVLRGQLVHGASTGGSHLNRTTLYHCLMMLAQMVPVILELVIDQGIDANWPELCYPPVR